MKFPFLDLARFNFNDEGGKGAKISHFITTKLLPRLPAGRSPVKAVNKVRKNSPHIEDIWAACDFGDERITRALPYHLGRFNLYYAAVMIPYFILSLGATFFAFAFGAKWLLSFTTLRDSLPLGNAAYSSNLSRVALLLLFNLVVFTYFFVVAVIAIRVAFMLVNRSFADTLCAVSLTYLLVDLCREDVLTNTRKRKEFISRIDDLARNTRLLSLRFYSKDGVNQEWVRSHFMQMEHYIRERERWTVAPVATTLADLRRDFGDLLRIFATGAYGEFNWGPIAAKVEPPTRARRALSAIPRLAAVLLPLLILGSLVWQQSRLVPLLGDNVSLVILITAAWALISIDAALKLGVVSGAINLAKELRSMK